MRIYSHDTAKPEGAGLRYKVDLKRFMADCEANFMRLQRLFPAMADDDHHRFLMEGDGEQVVVMRVLERTPYTSLLELCHVSGDSPWLGVPTMRVRMYHDAQLAEVVSCASQRRVRARNSYPNGNMHHPDEKAQWNRFLGEWLALCLQRGYTEAPPFVYASDG